MPGILIMNNNSGTAAGPRDGENKKRNHEGKLINGDRSNAPGTPIVNGAPLTGSGSAPPVTAPSASSPEKFAELPPEIAHLSEELYHPLSTLLMRISQETYNDLTDTLTAMAEVPLMPQMDGGLPNGLGAHGPGQENAEANRRKKLLLMKFAQDNRAKFIKLLVLTEWGKKASKEVAQLIDLFAWAREQNQHMDFVDTQIERIKNYSSVAAEPNPDIRTALEILSTGKAPWMPTMGFIPPEPMSSEQALNLLRYMNTSLSIRLNVHEHLPRRLQNWRIQSGRATFIVENELEFDVVSFVEDTSEQWWFLDIRLLFSPAPAIAMGSRFYNFLKNQADVALTEKGLAGLFDFLSNFILTHKITVLRGQALALLNSGWGDSLKVDKVHRELVVSYWTNRPGKKNWIEIGVCNNKARNGKTSWRGPPLPSLNVRWFRRGVEVKGVDFGFNWRKLSFEQVIKRVIAYHVNDIFRATQQNLNPSLSIRASLSDSDPADSQLQVALDTGSNSTTLCLEPFTGNCILQPATALSARTEFHFNQGQGRDPQQMANALTGLLAQTLRHNVQKHAQQLGWTLVTRQSLQKDLIKAAVKHDVLEYAMYSPRGWSSGWVLAVVVNVTGTSWWIFEIRGNGSAIDYAEQIKMERPDGSTLAINRSTLASLERVAVQILSVRVTARQLDKEKRSYHLQTEFGQAKVASEVQRMTRAWALYLYTADLLAMAPGERPWLESNLAIVCHGLRPEGSSLWHIATGRMVPSAAEDMRKLMAASPQSGFKFSEDGRFRILLCTPFGQDVLGELRARLRDVDRLRSFAVTLQKRGMRLLSSSLQRVEFQYGPSTHRAAVKFSAGKEVTVEITQSNPHWRVRNSLTEIANERVPLLPSVFPGDTSGLDRLCTTLILTRPIATTLNVLEASPTNLASDNPAIHAHALFKYRLVYENPVCTFDIRVQAKDDKVFWLIEDNMKKHMAEMRPTPERSPTHRRLDNLQAKLKALFASTGERWFGTRNGLVAELDGVGIALSKLNECVLSCKMEGGYKAPPPLVVPPQAARPAQPPPPPPQQQQVNAQQQAANQQRLQHQQQQQQAARQQQQQAQQQQQNQRRHAQQQQQQQQQNQRGQMPNGRGQQGGRPPNQQPARQQDIITIDD
jgi:mediator of RNA polymerase II transcription subunit 14